MALNRPPDAWSQALDATRKKYLGHFDTKLLCNCDKANITDHATEHDPNAPRVSIWDVRFGPGPSDFERLQNFRVFHEYSCDECGATYRSDVIEGKREYKPLEVREPINRIPGLSDGEIEGLRSLMKKVKGKRKKKQKK